MATSGEISFYVDTLLVETALAEPYLYKKAGFIADALSRIKEYLSSKIDKENPVSSVLNLLAPAAISMLFSSMGFGKFGLLLGFLTTVFHVDVAGMIKSLYEKVKEMISGGQKVSTGQIDQSVQETIQSFLQPSTTQEAEQGYQTLQQQQHSSLADDGKVYSSLELLHSAKIINLALIEYERQNMRLIKEADRSSFLKGFSGTKAQGTSLLGKILGWIFKFVLTAAGLITAGAIAEHFMGGGGGQSEPEAPSGPVSTQTKYRPLSNGPIPNQIPISNTPQNIEDMLIQFAKDTYSGLDGKESIIKSTPGFQYVKEKIAWQNVYNPGSRTIIIPPIFSSKKQMVDYFIDEVAQRDI
jgi:hypothetical protein